MAAFKLHSSQTQPSYIIAYSSAVLLKLVLPVCMLYIFPTIIPSSWTKCSHFLHHTNTTGASLKQTHTHTAQHLSSLIPLNCYNQTWSNYNTLHLILTYQHWYIYSYEQRLKLMIALTPMHINGCYSIHDVRPGKMAFLLLTLLLHLHALFNHL